MNKNLCDGGVGRFGGWGGVGWVVRETHDGSSTAAIQKINSKKGE